MLESCFKTLNKTRIGKKSEILIKLYLFLLWLNDLPGFGVCLYFARMIRKTGIQISYRQEVEPEKICTHLGSTDTTPSPLPLQHSRKSLLCIIA